MLAAILEKSGLSKKSVASLLGIHEELFSDWVEGRRPIPHAKRELLSSVLGISGAVLDQPTAEIGKMRDLVPAIWFKFRGLNLSREDVECTVVMRQLAFYLNEFEQVLKRTQFLWQPLFEFVRKRTNMQDSPAEQGEQAARAFLDITELTHGGDGIGELIRPFLRNKGILVIESALPESAVEGLSFYLGDPSTGRPCIFSNNHSTLWFRRNHVILHELGHLIFDVPTGAASVDFANDGSHQKDPVAEARAQAFAQHVLASKEVLSHTASAKGIKWGSLAKRDLATLVALVHVDKEVVVAAALEAGLLTDEQADHALKLDITRDLREMSDHALSTDEYLSKIGKTRDQFINNRLTTIPSRALQLPVHYRDAVVKACREYAISVGKAAELLMMEKRDFLKRYPDAIPEPLAQSGS